MNLLRLFQQIILYLSLRMCYQTNFSPFLCSALYCRLVTLTRYNSQLPSQLISSWVHPMRGTFRTRGLEKEKSQESPAFSFPGTPLCWQICSSMVPASAEEASCGSSYCQVTLVPTSPFVLLASKLHLLPIVANLCFQYPLFGFSAFLLPVKTNSWIKLILSKVFQVIYDFPGWNQSELKARI